MTKVHENNDFIPSGSLALSVELSAVLESALLLKLFSLFSFVSLWLLVDFGSFDDVLSCVFLGRLNVWSCVGVWCFVFACCRSSFLLPSIFYILYSVLPLLCGEYKLSLFLSSFELFVSSSELFVVAAIVELLLFSSIWSSLSVSFLGKCFLGLYS